MLIGASMSAAESAETRSWRTFPANLQIGRFYLKEGEHDVEILPEGHSQPIVKQVKISGDYPSVIIARVAGGGQRGPLGRVKVVGDRSDKRMEFAVINSMIEKEPHRGELKMERARMCVKYGDYDIESDVLSGISNGGDMHEGVELLVISAMVREEFLDVEKWSRVAVEKKLGSKARYEYYGKSAKYLRGKAKAAPSGAPSLTKKKAIGNAFNYFLAGLILDKNLKYEKASGMYANAMKYGLKGRPVTDKFLEAFKNAPNKFKKSPEGKSMISIAADSMESDIQ